MHPIAPLSASRPDRRGRAGLAFGGGFELALACDFLVAADVASFRCVEVTTAMLPIAGASQRLAERVGRGSASRFAMLGEPIPGGGRRARYRDTRRSAEKLVERRRARQDSSRHGPTTLLCGDATLFGSWSTAASLRRIS